MAVVDELVEHCCLVAEMELGFVQSLTFGYLRAPLVYKIDPEYFALQLNSKSLVPRHLTLVDLLGKLLLNLGLIEVVPLQLHSTGMLPDSDSTSSAVHEPLVAGLLRYLQEILQFVVGKDSAQQDLAELVVLPGSVNGNYFQPVTKLAHLLR